MIDSQLPAADQNPPNEKSLKSCASRTKATPKCHIKENRPPPSDAKILKDKLSQPFDPHDFGKEDGIGCFGAMVHIIRTTIGSGILMMPYAMKHLGCIPGTFLIILAGVIYYHNLHILLENEYRLCKRLKVERLTFIGVTDSVFEKAAFPINKFGPPIRYLTYVYFTIPTALATYLIILATNIQHMAEYFDVQLNRTYLIIAMAIPLTSFCLVKRILKILVPFSSAANIVTFLMTVVVMSCSLIYRKPEVTPNLVGELAFVPKGFAMFILAVRCTGIVLPIKNDMKTPKRFSGLLGSLNVSGFTIVMIYYTFATVCYLNYGDEVNENILSNLPKKNLISFATYLLYTLALSITYILAFFICYSCIWSTQLETTLKDGPYKTVIEYSIRIGINAGGLFLAVGVPQISLIAAMAGTLGILIEIALPPLLGLLLMVGDKRKSCFVIFKNLFIVVIAAGLFCMSLMRCVSDVIKLYSD